MASIELHINGKTTAVDVASDTPLLWVLRDTLGLSGTKFGCGLGQCGACTVLVDDQAVRSCVVPVTQAVGKHVVTIEGLSVDRSHPVQRAWIAEQVPQCGYCQSGMILTSVALLREKATVTDREIDRALAGHICRCGTYQRIRQAIHRAAADPTRRRSPGGAVSGRGDAQ